MCSYTFMQKCLKSLHLSLFFLNKIVQFVLKKKKITVKGFISLISFSSCLSFEWRKATDAFELILYPATFLKLYIWFKRFLVEFWGSLKYNIMSSAKSDNLNSSLPFYIHLTSFCCLIVLAKTSSTI